MHLCNVDCKNGKINCKPRAVAELVQTMPRRSVIVNKV